MATIDKISAKFVTASDPGAGMDGRVYLGIGGREFDVDTSADDFKTGSNKTYVFGQGANVSHPEKNDPRDPQLQDVDVNNYPVYVRFEVDTTDEEWILDLVEVSAGGNTWDRLAGPTNKLWLGDRTGKTLYLKP